MSGMIWRSLVLFPVVMISFDAARLPTNKGDMADLRSFPDFEIVETVEKQNTNFSGIFHREYSVHYEGDFELELDNRQLYSWEEAWPATGRRVDQFIRFRETETSTPQHVTEKNDELIAEGLLSENANTNGKNRKKRKIFFTDTRRLVPLSIYGHRFPVVSVVKLSTGCTGTLVSPKHVLTAAHCIHDQSDYVEGFSSLKVGLLPNFKFSNKFQWIRVNESFLPNGWLMGNANIASRFDYALLELEETHKKPFFELAITEGRTKALIHFTAYEDDKPANTLWFRSCKVRVTDEHVLYHYCDAKPGSSGAGVYTWTRVRGEWNRRLIGVFSGYRWKSFKEWWKKDQDYNAAIRLNTLKYTQICGWMGKYAAKSCKQLKRSSS